MSLLSLSERLEVALTEADLDDDFARQLHRGGCTPDEIASRVAAQSGRDVTGEQVAAWLHEHGFPPCEEPDGRGECGLPSLGSETPRRCAACRKDA